MDFSLIWLPKVLLDAGLKVAEQPGWKTSGRGDVRTVVGVMCHHTGGSKSGNMPSLGVLTHGRSDLAGPLCQLGLGRDGTFFVVAAGRANHAGYGNWQGITTGNSSFIGIEAENTGQTTGPFADPWPAIQMDAYRRGCAAILKRVRADAIMCCGHREYALPQGRKPDPTFDMNDFRNQVAALMAGTAPAPSLIPAVDGENRPTLRRSSNGELVRKVQTRIGVPSSGIFDACTEAAVRDFQRACGLVGDGIVGPRTWVALLETGMADAPDRGTRRKTPKSPSKADSLGVTPKIESAATLAKAAANAVTAGAHVIKVPTGDTAKLAVTVDDGHLVPYTVALDGMPIIHSLKSEKVRLKLPDGTYWLNWNFHHGLEVTWSHAVELTVAPSAAETLDDKSSAKGDSPNTSGAIALVYG